MTDEEIARERVLIDARCRAFEHGVKACIDYVRARIESDDAQHAHAFRQLARDLEFNHLRKAKREARRMTGKIEGLDT